MPAVPAPCRWRGAARQRHEHTSALSVVRSVRLRQDHRSARRRYGVERGKRAPATCAVVVYRTQEDVRHGDRSQTCLWGTGAHCLSPWARPGARLAGAPRARELPTGAMFCRGERVPPMAQEIPHGGQAPPLRHRQGRARPAQSTLELHQTVGVAHRRCVRACAQKYCAGAGFVGPNMPAPGATAGRAASRTPRGMLALIALCLAARNVAAYVVFQVRALLRTAGLLPGAGCITLTRPVPPCVQAKRITRADWSLPDVLRRHRRALWPARAT